MPRRGESVSKILYIFLDEGGNFDFSKSGTKYFVLTALSKQRPFRAYRSLNELKYDLVEKGNDIEYFHASEDRQAVRNAVFQIITTRLKEVCLDSLIIEKRKTAPFLHNQEKFYSEMIGHLVSHVIGKSNIAGGDKVIVFTDNIPVHRKRESAEKAIRQGLSHKLGEKVPYEILHHQSKSNFDLQIIDYCNWAIYRKWESGDRRSYEMIRRALRSEFDIFRNSRACYY